MDDGSLNPMELKKRLAGELVGQFHDPDASREARRLISQGAVQLDGERVGTDCSACLLEPGVILRAGRRRTVRLVER